MVRIVWWQSNNFYLGGYYNNWQPCSVVHRCKSLTSLINRRAHYDIDLGKENLTRPQPKLACFLMLDSLSNLTNEFRLRWNDGVFPYHLSTWHDLYRIICFNSWGPCQAFCSPTAKRSISHFYEILQFINLDSLKVTFYAFYHGKSPLNHPGEYVFIVSEHLKQIQVNSEVSPTA